VTFLWPEMLWTGLLLPALVALYWLAARRRRQAALRYPNLGLAREAIGRWGAWRRHLAPVLLFVALAALVVAAARPSTSILLPRQQQTIMLVMDVSASMGANDVLPSRLAASQDAARRFIEAMPSSVRIGVVAYGGSANLVQPPTFDREEAIAAINRFELQRQTAIGSGILTALATLFPDAGIQMEMVGPDGSGERMLGSAALADLKAPSAHKSIEPGSYPSAAIVLLSDGQSNTGTDPMDAAQLAANYGVKVFTVGFGSKEGTVITYEGWRVRVALDEDTLRHVANLTQGEYFPAGNGDDLRAVYQTLGSRIALERKPTEITALFAGLAGALVVLAMAFSLWWFGRVM
jgi:Ca-activated chloride channel family protein